MKAILAVDMEHEGKLRDALGVIAAAEPTLSSAALAATRRSGVVLQSRFNEIAEEALKLGSLNTGERRKIVGLIRYSEPESFDAMLRCRMSTEQLKVELPARARKAGFTDISKYVRWVLFGTGEQDIVPETPKVESAPPQVTVEDNWDKAIDAAVEAVKGITGRPRMDSVIKSIESIRRQ